MTKHTIRSATIVATLIAAAFALGKPVQLDSGLVQGEIGRAHV